jgi:hypothetical protein
MPLDSLESADAWRYHQARLPRKMPVLTPADRLASIDARLMQIAEHCRRIAAKGDADPKAPDRGSNGPPFDSGACRV